MRENETFELCIDLFFKTKQKHLDTRKYTRSVHVQDD